MTTPQIPNPGGQQLAPPMAGEQWNWGDLIASAGAGFEPLPVGTYDFQVTESEATKTSNGKPMIKTKMKVTGGPHNGRTVFNNFVISAESPGAMGYFFQHMEAFGLPKTWFQQNNPPLDSVAGALVNRTCRAKLKQKTYQGQIRNEVDGIMPPGQGMPGVIAGGPPAQGTVSPVIPQVAMPVAAAPPAAPPVAAPPVAPVAPPQGPVAAPEPPAPPAAVQVPEQPAVPPAPPAAPPVAPPPAPPVQAPPAPPVAAVPAVPVAPPAQAPTGSIPPPPQF